MTEGWRDRSTHRQTQATAIPGGQNWPQVKKIYRSYIQVTLDLYSHFRCLQVLYHVRLKYNYINLSTVLLSGFQSSLGALKTTKAVSGQFHGSGRHSKCNGSQDRANFHRSQAWQIVLIVNTVNMTHFHTIGIMCHELQVNDTI